MKKTFDKRIGDYVYSLGTPKWKVTSVLPKTDYTLVLTFADGETRVYNALPLLEKGIYAPLKSLPFFMSAKVGGGTVVWNDDVDIAPEHLYEQSIPQPRL